LALLLLVALVLLVFTASTLVAAGDHADATETLTPNDEALWIRAVIAFVVLVGTITIFVSGRVRSRHPALAVLASLLFGLSLSLLAFDVYWWFAAGSNEDMAQKQIPLSDWKTDPLMGLAILGSSAFDSPSCPTKA
jgi:hypothetical protein